MIREAIAALVSGRSLTTKEAALVMEEIMEGEVTPAQFGAFVTSLRIKGETAEEIAGLAKPLGRNKQTLLLGVDDSMAMQEMHFLTQQVLQAVNNALGEVFFDKVHIDLLSGRSSLDSLQQSLMRGRTPKERTSVRILQDAGVPVQELGRQIGNFSDSHFNLFHCTSPQFQLNLSSRRV